MELFDLLNFTFDAQLSCGAMPAPTPIIPADPVLCPECNAGSAFTPIAAAFTTLGYYAQANWLDQIYDHNLALFAVLLYVVAAIRGLIGFVMGANVKQYVWLFVGPPIFWWLTDQRVAVPAVKWIVGQQERNMEEVYRNSEVGLLNDDYVITNGIQISNNASPVGGSVRCGGVDGACVSDFFAYFDYLLSDTIQQLVGMLGLGRARSNDSAGGDTTIVKGIIGNKTMQWDLAEDLRWSFFADITGARIQDPALRRLFSIFMASSCGDEFTKQIDKSVLTSIKSGSKSPLNTAILPNDDPAGLGFISGTAPDYSKFWSHLASVPQKIPVYTDLKNTILYHPSATAVTSFEELLKANRVGIEGNILEFTGDLRGGGYPIDQYMNCSQLLTIVMQGIRWQAAHIAYQIMTSGPKDVLPSDYLTMMLYGWDISDPDSGEPIQYTKLDDFVEAMVLAYLFRNELEMTGLQTTETNFTTASQRTVSDLSDYQRINNQYEKFGELYTWAKLVPYFQGKLLYFLAMAYPFAAMFVLVPGMSKVFMQWMQFWVWVKLWDLGFAMVLQLERSIWAMTGNGFKAIDTNSTIYQLMSFNSDSAAGNICTPIDDRATIPAVAVKLWDFTSDNEAGALVDRLLALSGNIDLDLANTNYIYIMTALYFAVPTLTGSLVLGAKSGMASMIGSTIGGIASPVGRSAGTSAAGDFSGRMGTYQAAMGQQGYVKGAQKFAGGVIDAQNVRAENALLQAARNYGNAALNQAATGMNQTTSSGWTAASIGGAMPGMTMDALGAAGKTLGPLLGSIPATGKAKEFLDKFSSGIGGGGGGTGTGAGGGSNPGDPSRSGGDFGGPPGADPEDVGGLKKATSGASSGAGFMMGKGLPFLINLANQSRAQAGIKAGLAFGSGALDSNRLATQSGMRAELVGLEAGRSEAELGFSGDSSSFMARDNYNAAMASKAAAVTGSTGGTNPGPMPVNMMGMGRQGYFGAGVQASANSSSSGGALGSAMSGHFNQMDKMNGQWAYGFFTPQTPMATISDGFRQAGLPQGVADAAAQAIAAPLQGFGAFDDLGAGFHNEGPITDSFNSKIDDATLGDYAPIIKDIVGS